MLPIRTIETHVIHHLNASKMCLVYLKEISRGNKMTAAKSLIRPKYFPQSHISLSQHSKSSLNITFVITITIAEWLFNFLITLSFCIYPENPITHTLHAYSNAYYYQNSQSFQCKWRTIISILTIDISSNKTNCTIR